MSITRTEDEANESLLRLENQIAGRTNRLRELVKQVESVEQLLLDAKYQLKKNTMNLMQLDNLYKLRKAEVEAELSAATISLETLNNQIESVEKYIAKQRAAAKQQKLDIQREHNRTKNTNFNSPFSDLS